MKPLPKKSLGSIPELLLLTEQLENTIDAFIFKESNLTTKGARRREAYKGDDPDFRRNRIQARLDDLLEQGMSIMRAYDILADEFDSEDLDLL